MIRMLLLYEVVGGLAMQMRQSAQKRAWNAKMADGAIRYA
jgi:hypothetical protein